MQFVKDSFYIALRDRLATLNPTRTVTVDGTLRPAIVVRENEAPGMQVSLTNVFCITWGAESSVSGNAGPGALHALGCTIEYSVTGSDSASNTDRGRQLAAMDIALMQICLPASAPKCDYTQTPPVQLGSTICWGEPTLTAAKIEGKMLTRTAGVQVYFLAEVNCA